MELVIEDDRVDGTLDGVLLLETLLKVEDPSRSLSLREKEGNLRSILLVMLCADEPSDRRRLARWDSVSKVLKYSFSKLYA